MKPIVKTLLAAAAVMLSLALPARADGGQDFPFFVCATHDDAAQHFIVGPSQLSETGFAVWMQIEDGSWATYPIEVQDEGASYLAKGKVGVKPKPFELRIPSECIGSCGSRVSFGDKRCGDEINASCQELR